MKSYSGNSFNQFTSNSSDFLNLQASVSAWKITRFLLCLIAILVSLSLVSHIALYLLPDFPGRDVFSQKFSVDKEHNFPTLYSSLALFFCSVLFWIISQYKAQNKDQYTGDWKALSVIFVCLSIDEIIGIHEHLIRPLNNLGIDGFWKHAWVIPGSVLFAIFLVSFYRFFKHLPRYMKRLTLLGVMIFAGGALVIELFGGYYRYLYGEYNFSYALIITVEESMEMIGVLLLIHALLLYIYQLGITSIQVRFDLAKKKNNLIN